MKELLKLLTVAGICLLSACHTSQSAALDPDACTVPYASSNLTEYTLYQLDAQTLPELPEKVVPLYDIVIARHGSRYLDGKGSYTIMLNLFSDAERDGVITQQGKEFLAWYKTLYPLVTGHESQLTQMGHDQHYSIAQSLGQWLPTLFEGKPSVRIATSTSQRVIDSQEAFMEGLTSIHPAIRPAFAIDTTERLRVHNRWELNEPCASAYAAYKAQRFDLPGFIARFFTDGDLPSRYFGDNYNFVRVMRNMLASLQSLDFQAPDGWQPFFGEADFAAVHDIQSSFTMLLLGRSSLSGNIGLEWYRDVWQSVLDNTLTDLEQGRVAAGLYFTHDILIDNLLAVLRLDRFGDDIQPMEAITAQYPISAVPMASNLQLCICLDQASGETIVYPLLNGRCGRLQGLQEVRPGAYRWEEVAARLRQ